MDNDGLIGLEDMRKFLMSYSDDDALEDGACENMLYDIIEWWSRDNEKDEKANFDTPAEWNNGPKFISFTVFQDLLNEVNDSIRKEKF